jgi:sugar fermentation stimulation protein A
MQFQSPLIEGLLLRRYQRFLADVDLGQGGIVTAHCPNPGTLLGLNTPGARVWLSESAAPSRRLKHTLELIEANDPAGPTLVGVNTGRPNRLVENAIRAGVIAELAGYQSLRREVRYGLNSRIDLLLTGGGRPDCYVEVKNVHLSRQAGLAEFPDCVTARGTKHLRELSAVAAAGQRAVLVFCVQRADAAAFAPAADIDPAYAAALPDALEAGVECLVYRCHISTAEIRITDRLPLATLPPSRAAGCTMAAPV